MRTWRDCLIERLSNRERAILEDYEICKRTAVALRALQTVVESQRGILQLAKQADMDPQGLSEMQSDKDIPYLTDSGMFSKCLVIKLLFNQ